MMSEPTKPPKYDRAFKNEVVRLVTELGRNVAEVAHEVGVHENTLYKWIRQATIDPENAFPGKGHMKQEDEELHRLRREVANLREENEILKKAMAIFTKRPK